MLKSNGERMLGRIKKIASFSDDANMITRLTYSKSWVECINWLSGVMKEEGMQVRMDSFGNLIGLYNPFDSKKKPVAIASHIDTVKNAGAYDGVAGIVVGLEIVSMLKENNIVPKRPIEVIATADEEGAICQKGYFGARFMTGMMSIKEVLSYKNIENKNLIALQKESGIFDNNKFGEDIGWAKDYYDSFYEVHIEQGDVLHKANMEIGVVKGVVGIGRIGFEYYGEADHAGPTSMSGRKDSLVASSDAITKIWELAQKHNNRAVITIGRITNSPNIHNVISDLTSFIVDYRSDDDNLSHELAKNVIEICNEVSNKYGVNCSINKNIYTPVKLFNDKLIGEIEQLNIPKSMKLFSWAGHDAKAFAEIVPTAMIFMPSVNGKSHSPLEYTEIKSFEIVCDNIASLF